MKSCLPASFSRLCIAAALGLTLTATASAQDSTFQDAVNEYLRGNYEIALDKFKEVLADNPSHEDAYRYLEKAGQEVLLLMLVKDGEYETVAQRFLEIAREARADKQNDEGAISALFDEAMNGNYMQRRDALLKLSADHGEFGAAPFVAELGNEENETRVNAIFCLTRLSGDAVLPLIAALRSEDPRTQQNAAACLGVIKDVRASAYLKQLFDTTGNETVRMAAGEAFENLTGKNPASPPSSTDLHIQAAEQYFRSDDRIVRPFDTNSAVWSWDGSGVVATEVPTYLRHLKLAEQHCRAALHDAAARERLLAVQAAELAAMQQAAASEGEEMDSAASGGLRVALAAGGPDAMAGALRFALDEDAQATAITLIDTLARLGSGNDSVRGALSAALQSSYKSVRYHAAMALADGQAGADVVSTLASALNEDAIRTVLVVDNNDGTRNAMQARLKTAGYSVVTASNGAEGFMRSRSTPPKDLVVLRAGLTDVTTDAFVYDSDFRAAASPILLVADDTDSVESMYGGKGKVAGVVAAGTDEAFLASVSDAMGDLNEEREMALEAARAAAASLAHLSSAALKPASADLVQALARDDDPVVGPVLAALGRVGGKDAVTAVAAIFGDDSRSEDIRVAAANALGGIFSRLSANPGDDILAPLKEAAASADSEALRVAAGRALGWAAFLTDDERAAILAAHG